MGDTPDVRVLRRLSELAELVRAEDGLYVRFGPNPDEEQDGSVDYESGLRMPGLSVNPLAPQAWWTRPLEDWLARQVCQYVHLAERSAQHAGWVVRGRIVGYGPDSEPLLTETTAVARLSGELVAEARHRYRERFHHGRTGH